MPASGPTVDEHFDEWSLPRAGEARLGERTCDGDDWAHSPDEWRIAAQPLQLS
jgi:hypothetical protein